MSHEEFPSDQTHEVDREVYEDFRHSADRLFTLADAMQHSKQPILYNIQWDEQRPSKISNLTIIRAVATGARKQEYKGKFNQAQFKITEMSDTDDKAETRFIWLPTELQPPGTPISPDWEAIATDFDYHNLKPNTIAQALIDRVQSIEDYMILLRAVSQRNLPSMPEFQRYANKLVHRLAYGNPNAPGMHLDIQANSGVITELTNLLETADPYLAVQVQSRIVTKLLGRIAGPSPIEPGTDEQTAPDKAAVTLEIGLREGIIPNERRFTERILTHFPVYQYRFASELLHTTLENRTGRSSVKNILGIERTTFAGNFISTILNTHMQEGGEASDEFRQFKIHLVHILDRISYSEKGADFDPFVQLANSLRNDREAIQPEVHDVAAGPLIANLRAVKGAFLTILRKLRTNGPEATQGELELDEKQAQIIDMVLEPVIKKMIGRHTLEVVGKDADPTEAKPDQEK